MLWWLGVSLHVWDVLFGWHVDDSLAVSSRLASGICVLYEKVSWQVLGTAQSKIVLGPFSDSPSLTTLLTYLC